jgi:hypothetical protein
VLEALERAARRKPGQERPRILRMSRELHGGDRQDRAQEGGDEAAGEARRDRGVPEVPRRLLLSLLARSGHQKMK